MHLLEIAQRLVGYDPAATPEKELADARRLAEEAEARYQHDRQRLSELDDTAVYEWRHNDEHGYTVPRTVAKQTAKQVRLSPKYEGEKQTYLPRKKLDAGEFIQLGRGWWQPEFAFGWAIRPRLEEQLRESRKRLVRRNMELQKIEEAIANGDVVLDPTMMNSVLSVYHSIHGRLPDSIDRRMPINIDWQTEGF